MNALIDLMMFSTELMEKNVMNPLTEALPFIRSHLDQYGIEWVNQDRESGDAFKFLIYGKVGGGRQIGIYNRKTTVIRLECYDRSISGVTVLAKCAITHTANADYSHFQNGKGICVSVDNLTALKSLFDWYFMN